ncbi:MAG TPA: O-succinylhomoserine sulfhydrylase [Geobacterales bacterium]|nr:O-succinylhomoserine sulfhydrylase [Geobacterales bacterium]
MSDTDGIADLHPDTLLVHGGTLRSSFGETSEALFLTSGFVYESAAEAEARFKNEVEGYTYSRFANPTNTMFETRMALLEGAEAARSTATGMAAVSAALLGYLKAGDHVVAAKALFGACRVVIEEMLPRFGISSTLVDGRDLSAWRGAIRDNTRVLFCESPANPTLELVDLAGVAAVAKSAGALFMVDNVFATPLLQSPLKLGADVVIYSATKHIDGQGRCLGGVVLSNKTFILDHLQNYLRQTGPSLSPFNAWVLLKGLETLPLRVERQTASAAKIADFLAERPEVERVMYPGRADHPQRALAEKQMKAGGPLVAFHLRADKAATFRFMDALRVIKISNNLGDAKSLIAHPATTTHQRLNDEAKAELGITPGTVRLSVGLEHADDLMADLAQALSGTFGRR